MTATTDLLFAIAAPENGSLHVDMLARMMQMLMNEDFVEKLKAAKSPKELAARLGRVTTLVLAWGTVIPLST